MKETINLIERVTEFATNPEVKSKNKILELKQLLVSIYAKYLDLEESFDSNDYVDDFDFPYENLKENIEKNFPSFGWYNLLLDCHKIKYKNGEVLPEVDLVLGDPIDDITDILKDLLEVKWRFDNNSEDDAIWNFKFIMKHHSEQHLVHLLKFLKDFENY